MARTANATSAIRIESGITKNQIISELAKSPHGKLEEYVPLGQAAAKQDPEFLAHLIAWNQVKGQVRDSKAALPVVSLSIKEFPKELGDNSLAHLALLGPRELLRAVRFGWKLMGRGRMERVRGVVERYLRSREEPWRKFDRTAVLHRQTLKELYALLHIKPSPRADSILFKGDHPPNSVFAVVAELKNMSASDAASAIMKHRIPFLIAQGALGKKMQEPELALAVIEQMTPTEVVTSTKLLERLGLKQNAALRGAYEKKLEQVAGSKRKANVLKTTKAADAMTDEHLKAKLQGVQERQLAGGTVEGNWLVLGDKSPSMEKAIDAAKQVAAVLARMVRGKVHLVFFDSYPRYVDAMGKTLDQLNEATKFMLVAGGGTSIGCGVQYAIENKFDIDGIAIVSDAKENTAPFFTVAYKQLSVMLDKQVPVYLYRFPTGMTGFQDRDLKDSMRASEFDMQEFDMQGVDYYSIPNMVSTMRTNRYSLVDEIMSQPLLTLDEVFKFERKEEEEYVA